MHHNASQQVKQLLHKLKHQLDVGEQKSYSAFLEESNGGTPRYHIEEDSLRSLIAMGFKGTEIARLFQISCNSQEATQVRD